MKIHYATLETCHDAADTAVVIDAFDFAMPVTRENGQYIMRAIKP